MEVWLVMGGEQYESSWVHSIHRTEAGAKAEADKAQTEEDANEGHHFYYIGHRPMPLKD